MYIVLWFNDVCIGNGGQIFIDLQRLDMIHQSTLHNVREKEKCLGRPSDPTKDGDMLLPAIARHFLPLFCSIGHGLHRCLGACA